MYEDKLIFKSFLLQKLNNLISLLSVKNLKFLLKLILNI